MRRMSIIIAVVAGVVVVALGAGALACGGWKAIGTHFENDYSSAAQIAEIRVNGNTVALEFRPATGSGVDIHRTARYLNYFHDRPAPTHRVEGNVLYLDGESSMFSSIEYVVTAPAGVRVTADIGTGSLDLTAVSAVNVRISTGSIKVTDGTGDVAANIGTGAIAVDLATAGNVEAKTGTGSVDVTVPADAYRVDASSKMGEVKLGLPNDPNGRFRLALRTDMGRVTLAAA